MSAKGAQNAQNAQDLLAGKYFVEFAGRSKHNLPFPVVAMYGRIVGRTKPRSGEKDDLYAVEVYEFGSPEVRMEQVPASRTRSWRLFDEWRQMRLWISDVYMPAVRVEVFGGAGGEKAEKAVDLNIKEGNQ
jgi:hypothetical protein